MTFKKGQSGNPKGRAKIVLEDGRALSDVAKEYTTEAIETLASVMREGQSDKARISAANALLDRGWGRPKQDMDLGVNLGAELASIIAERRERIVNG